MVKVSICTYISEKYRGIPILPHHIYKDALNIIPLRTAPNYGGIIGRNSTRRLLQRDITGWVRCGVRLVWKWYTSLHRLTYHYRRPSCCRSIFAAAALLSPCRLKCIAEEEMNPLEAPPGKKPQS